MKILYNMHVLNDFWGLCPEALTTPYFLLFLNSWSNFWKFLVDFQKNGKLKIFSLTLSNIKKFLKLQIFIVFGKFFRTSIIAYSATTSIRLYIMNLPAPWQILRVLQWSTGLVFLINVYHSDIWSGTFLVIKAWLQKYTINCLAEVWIQFKKFSWLYQQQA